MLNKINHCIQTGVLDSEKNSYIFMTHLTLTVGQLLLKCDHFYNYSIFNKILQPTPSINTAINCDLQQNARTFKTIEIYTKNDQVRLVQIYHSRGILMGCCWLGRTSGLLSGKCFTTLTFKLILALNVKLWQLSSLRCTLYDFLLLKLSLCWNNSP